MKHAQLIFMLVLGLMLVLSSSVTSEYTFDASNDNEMLTQMIPSYTEYPAISIDNDTHFDYLANLYGWDGSGAIDQPYLIKNYNITDDGTCILIQNVTETYFKISGCYLTYETSVIGYGIRLNNVTTGIIENTTIISKNYAIYLTDSNNTRILNCTIDDTYSHAIYISGAWNTAISDVEVRNGQWGIIGFNTYQTTIDDVYIHGNDDAGIYFEDSDYLTIQNSNVSENDDDGIAIWYSPYATIDNCDLISNNGHGVYLYDSEYSSITDCYVYDNEFMIAFCGITVESSHNVSILSNIVDDNLPCGINLDGAPDAVVKHNIITNNEDHGLYIDGSDRVYMENNTISSNGNMMSIPRCGISAIYSDDCEVYNCTIESNIANGITLEYCDEWLIHNSSISDNLMSGISMRYSVNNTIRENLIADNHGYSPDVGCGIEIHDCGELSIDENVIANNAESGITGIELDFSNITNNEIYSSDFCGIHLDRAINLTISSNMMYSQEIGLLMEHCINNTVTWNIAFDNDYGIISDYGENNTFYYNDLGWNSNTNAYDDNGKDEYWSNDSNVGNWYSDYSGTGTYPITGSTGAIDYYPSRSLYAGHADNVTYQLGSEDNFLDWNCSALNGWKFMAYKDGLSYFNDSWDGKAVQLDVDGFSLGEFNVTVFFYHISGYHVNATAFVTVIDTRGPSWATTPENQIVEFGSRFEYDVDAIDPSGVDTYWINSTYWFSIDADGVITNNIPLDISNYHIQISVNDTLGHTTTYTITISVQDTVAPTIISSPHDLEYEVGDTGNSLAWNCTDLDPDIFVIYRNGTEIDSDDWISGGDGIVISVDGLAVGVYNFTIVVFDGSGNSATHTVWVTVTPAETTSTTTPTTGTSPTGTTTPPPIDPTTLGLAVAGLGIGAVVVIVVAFSMKKKSSS